MISLILMDYPNRRRLKIWGKSQTGRCIADEPQLVDSLHDAAYRARPERAVVITDRRLRLELPAAHSAAA